MFFKELRLKRNIARRQTVEPLIVALRDGNENVRRTAAAALGRIGDARAVEPLIAAALRDGNENVRRTAAAALDKIDRGWAQSEAAQRQVPSFIAAALRDKNWDINQLAVAALVAIGIPAVGPLIAALRDRNWGERQAATAVLDKIDRGWAQSEAAQRQVPSFIATLQDGNGDVRGAAAAALGQIGDDRAVEPLLAALRDRDKDVRGAAAAALGRIGDGRAVEPLLAALRDRDEDVRGAAAAALGRIGDDRAVEPLLVTLRDGNRGVCQAATNALEKIQQANQRLLTHYPQLFCRPCGLRATSLEVSLGFFKFVICRGCKCSLGLLTGVREVRGLIGGNGEALRQEGETVLIHLWSETDKTARNADIDCLMIQTGGIENYDRAVNAVINVLKSDASRPAKWCKQIPVILQGNPPLSHGTLNMLKDTFKEVRVE